MALNEIPSAQRSPISTESVAKGYGLIEWDSDDPIEDTVKRVKDAVLSQGDTVWFGEVDYQQDAAAIGVDIPPAILLLFGGPAPGGEAMADYPKLGLDAFCQKLLVYQDGQGNVKVAFNDIVAFARLHDGSSNMPNRSSTNA